MNILIVSPNKIWGGAATANAAIAAILKGCGHNVILNDEYYPNDKYNGVDVDHFSTHDNIFSQREFRSFVISNHIEVIIWGNALLFQYYFPTVRFFKRIGVRQIAILHSLSLSNSVRDKLTDWIISRMSFYLDNVVCVSQYTKKSWCKFSAFRTNKEKMIVIHNSINQIFSPRVLDREKLIRVGFVGRFSEEKQPEIFCSLSECCDYEFHAFGIGPMLENVQSHYPRVNYHGQVNDEEIIYRNLDILVVTSKFENCPMVILEAMSHGIPVVAPSVGGIPEITNDGVDSVLYDGYTQVKIIGAINKVVNNYDAYSKQSVANAQNFSSHKLSSYWECLLNNI